ncbi:MAG: DUF1236 domain-containing protein [Bradyrhizobium sp.]
MTNRFLISVAAAALIAGTGFANAQGAGGAMNQGGSAAQHSAPAAGGGAAPSRESAPPSGMTSGQSEKAAPGGKHAEDIKGGKDMKAEGREGREKSTVGQAPEKSGSPMQRDEKMGRDKNAPSSAQGREDRMNAQKGSTDQKGSMDQKGAQTTPSSGSQTTTGNAATSARVAAPPPEKQTQIVSAIKSERIQETNINVNVSIGTVLPASVHFVPLPPRIVEIYPEWRGYEVVLIHGRYVIVRPATREIVYIIEG